MEQKEFLGLTQNDVFIQGPVAEDPVITGENFAFFKIKTNVREPDANGQWTDVRQDVPIITTDPKKVAAIAKFVTEGKRLLVYGYYKSWVNGDTPQHAFVMVKMVFGGGGRDNRPEQTGGVPNLPQ